MHWQDQPYRLIVKKGEKKSFCKCGKTKKPPFCDGSHCDTGIEPYRVTFEEDRKVSICGLVDQRTCLTAMAHMLAWTSKLETVL